LIELLLKNERACGDEDRHLMPFTAIYAEEGGDGVLKGELSGFGSLEFKLLRV
jgi:hypothetical protein